MGNKKISSSKRRLDVELLNRQLAASLVRAKALIMAGDVLVRGQVEYKAHRIVAADTDIRLKEKYPYVSRGAEKLKQALVNFSINVKNLKVIDIGISTGGFTDLMLSLGAEIITGVDVNIAQVDHRIRCHSRVRLLRKNARYLEKEDIKYMPDLITIDVSFISIIKIISRLYAFKNARVVALIKPQFEVKKLDVEKGGVITSQEKVVEVLIRLKNKIMDLGFSIVGITPAGLKGRRGNQEYFFLLDGGKKVNIDDKIIHNAVKI